MQNKKNPIISIVIPVKNGKHTLSRLLEGFRKQTLFSETEVVLIDSGSTDGTLALLERFPEVYVHSIDPASFNHGKTRNLGSSLAKGKFVVMTVQDAWTEDKEWLAKMLRHFDDPEVAGVCGGQAVPHHSDKNPHEWFRPVSKPVAKTIHFPSSSGFEALLPEKKRTVCAWDDVAAMYRKNVLLNIPFQAVTFGEDMLWAREALRAGHKLVYEPEARVNHYHHVDFDYEYKRSLTDFYFGYQFFQLEPKIQEGLDNYLKLIWRNFKYRAPLYWIPYNITKMKAILKAQDDFKNALNQGEEVLHELHAKHCAQAPQAVINSHD